METVIKARFGDIMDRLEEILSTMEIPESRERDWSWLLRNLWFVNSTHKDLKEAFKLLKVRYHESYGIYATDVYDHGILNRE